MQIEVRQENTQIAIRQAPEQTDLEGAVYGQHYMQHIQQ